MLSESTRQGTLRQMMLSLSNNDFVITEVKKKFKVWYEIGGIAGYKGDVNFMNLDADIVDGGCNEKVLKT